MGCGKSFIGKDLADKLGFLFADLDSLIVSNYSTTEGSSIAKIFDNEGETYFRKLESDTLRGVGKWSNLVVATGGGAACFHENMAWMNENGVTIYLKTSPQLLVQRLKNETEKRPLLRGKSDEELLEFIEKKVKEREPFYDQANIIISQETNDENLIFEILEKILLHKKKNDE